MSSISWPIGPSITARMCAGSRKTNGMLNTFTSGTTGPTGPSDVRSSWIAPTCVCSIISFSAPSTLPGNIWNLMRPFVAASIFLPMLSTAATVG